MSFDLENSSLNSEEEGVYNPLLDKYFYHTFLENNSFENNIAEEEGINEKENFNDSLNIKGLYDSEKNEEKSTANKTKQNEMLTNQKSEEDKKDSNDIYSYEDIYKIIENSNLNIPLENFKNYSYLKQAENDLKSTQRKRKRSKKNKSKNNENKKDNDNNINKRGRKKIINKNEECQCHSKFKADNIIKKIKAKIINTYCLNSVNKILAEYNKDKKDNIIKSLSYKYINQLKKKKDLEFLEMKLKDLYSLNISLKNKTKNENLNKLCLEKILHEKKDDETIINFFELRLRDYFDLFTMKKNKEDYKNLNEDIFKKIKGIDSLLNYILKKDGEKYYSYFIFFLYNYKKWFERKENRNTK